MFIPEVSSIERQVADLNNAPRNVPQDPSIKKKEERRTGTIFKMSVARFTRETFVAVHRGRY